MESNNHPVTKIFYFSSTGNSLIAARKIAEKLGNSQILSIPKIININIDFSAERIIIVSPVYWWGLPNIINRFLEKIQLNDRIGIFAVMTNAGLAGDPFRMVEKILKKKNLNLNSGFLVWMPENFTPRYGVWPLWLQNMCLKTADKKINRICNNIQNNKIGTREKSHYGINWLLTIQHKFYISKIFIEKSLKAEDYFWASDNCNGCGICAKICPVENIVMNDGKPSWGDNCEVCLGCIQWCPQKAAQFQKSTLKGKRYHHPDVVLNDFIMR